MRRVPCPFYLTAMVGHPKRLEDLAKIEAGVRVTCTVCKRERLLDREQLIRDLTRRGLSTDWSMLRRRLRCACGSRQVEILAMPFVDGGEDGEALLERLLRATEACIAASMNLANAEGGRIMADARLEFCEAGTAMRAWIHARST